MPDPVIVFTTEWRLVPTTCEPCMLCEDIIYGKQYELFMDGNRIDMILCESCYVAVITTD